MSVGLSVLFALEEVPLVAEEDEDGPAPSKPLVLSHLTMILDNSRLTTSIDCN